MGEKGCVIAECVVKVYPLLIHTQSKHIHTLTVAYRTAEGGQEVIFWGPLDKQEKQREA